MIMGAGQSPRFICTERRATSLKNAWANIRWLPPTCWMDCRRRFAVRRDRCRKRQCASDRRLRFVLKRRTTMPRDEHITHSADETVALGRALAATLKNARLVLLRGDLGAGKT